MVTSTDGRRGILGFPLGGKEDGAFRTEFLRSLMAHGLHRTSVELSSACVRVTSATSVVVEAAGQRCQVRVLPNGMAGISKDLTEMVMAFANFSVAHWK